MLYSPTPSRKGNEKKTKTGRRKRLQKKKKIKDRIMAEDGRRGNGTWNIF